VTYRASYCALVGILDLGWVFRFGGRRQEGAVVTHDRWQSAGWGSAPRHYVTDRWINVNGDGGDPNLGFCGCRGEGGVLKGTD
jgi:hypothetical protein